MKKSLNSDGQQFNQYQQIARQIIERKKDCDIL
jgi:hypothetical protein